MRSFLWSRATLVMLAGVTGLNSGHAPAHPVPPVPGVLGQVKSVAHDSMAGERMADRSVITVPTITGEGDNSNETLTDIDIE